MIGQLINTFDASDDNTVEVFNKLFNGSLLEPSDSIVVIGNMHVGGLRELFIDGISKMVVLNPKKDSPEFYYTATRESSKTIEANSIQELSMFLDVTIGSVKTSIGSKDRLVKGYKIRKSKRKGK